MPRGEVARGLEKARDLLGETNVRTVADALGSGGRTSAPDTVPFTLWAAAGALADYESAFWTTAQAGGDVDTTCAIVGGVIAAGGAGAPPAHWWESTEGLPGWLGHTV